MEWLAWQPIYRTIREQFGYSRREDRRSATRLADRLDVASHGRAEQRLRATLGGEAAIVAGDGPSLEHEAERAPTADATVVAADGAAPRLRDAGVAVDVVVTDLDGGAETCAALSRDGTPAVVHAHGDNAALIDEWLPRFAEDAVAGTTQARPEPPLLDPGGFTDGDRAAYLADAAGAHRIELVGFDLRDDGPGREKRWKLRWAERLLRLLEERRGEPLLD